MKKVSSKTPNTEMKTKRRRVSASERRALEVKRRRDIRSALSEMDREKSLAEQREIIAAYIPPRGQEMDDLARPFRHPQYETLSSLEATNIFVERFAVVLNSDEWPWGGWFRHIWLSDVSLPDLRYFWEARAQADALGMDYDSYIRAVTTSLIARGQEQFPEASKMRGQAALAVAAYANELEQVRYSGLEDSLLDDFLADKR